MGELDESDMVEFGKLERREKRSLYYEIYGGHRQREQEGDRISNPLYIIHSNGVMSAQTLEVSLFGMRTALHLERDARSTVT